MAVPQRLEEELTVDPRSIRSAVPDPTRSFIPFVFLHAAEKGRKRKSIQKRPRVKRGDGRSKEQSTDMY